MINASLLHIHDQAKTQTVMQGRLLQHQTCGNSDKEPELYQTPTLNIKAVKFITKSLIYRKYKKHYATYGPHFPPSMSPPTSAAQPSQGSNHAALQK